MFRKYRFYSLLDMKPFDVSAVALAVSGIAELSGNAAAVGLTASVAETTVRELEKQIRQQAPQIQLNIHLENLGGGTSVRVHEMIVSGLAAIEQKISGAPIPQRLMHKLARIKSETAEQPPDTFDAHAAHIRLADLALDFCAELREPKFLYIPPELRELYEQNDPAFGVTVNTHFKASIRDVSAAARCLALEEGTACVFHLMRALEQPLHLLADRVGVVFPTPLELENWKTIIDKIESKVNAEVKRLEQQPKSLKRNEELGFLGQTTIQFRHFKNAWRNDAAHAREHYEPREAQTVFDAVKSFMQMMADEMESRASSAASTP